MSAEHPTVTPSAGQARGGGLAQQTHREHHALLEAIHQLEAALASAAQVVNKTGTTESSRPCRQSLICWPSRGRQPMRRMGCSPNCRVPWLPT